VTDLTYVVEAFDGTRDDTLSKHSLEALQQIYGYMTFNNNEFGILTNWQRALFLRGVENIGSQNPSVLPHRTRRTLATCRC
jgi:hypothetical protein